MEYQTKEDFKAILRIAECERKFFPKVFKERVKKEKSSREIERDETTIQAGKNSAERFLLE